MAKIKFDGVITAMHEDENENIRWVRAFLRRGKVFTDRVNIDRDKLIKMLQEGKRFYTGSRIEYQAATFNLDKKVELTQANGNKYVFAGQPDDSRDSLEGVPFI
jgi:hypothetical protein